LAKAPDKIQEIALYGSKAFTSSGTPSIYANYIGTSPLEDQVIADWVSKGHTLVYLSNTNFISGGGYIGTTYTAAWKAKLKVFIAKCTANGIKVGVVGAVAYADSSASPFVYGSAIFNPAPAQRVVDYNNGATGPQKITNFLIEEEYWREIAGNMTFAQFKLACQAVYNIIHPAGVSNDIYFVRNAPTEAAQLAPYIDIWWMTTYLYSVTGRDTQPRYDQIHSWIVELAGTTPVTPIKAGALISLESYSYNKNGTNDVNNNFLGYWVEGRRTIAPFTNPQPIITSPKNYNQLADRISHNGTVGLPPIDFNSEPNSVTDYINWMGIQVFDYDLAPHLNILNANTNEVYAFGDGSPQDALEYTVAQQVANLVPYNAARLLYLGDVYNTGSQAEYIGTPRSFDTLYGTQSSHNLLILTSATMGSREWANRATGYDLYWSGQLAGVGTVQPNWDGDRTITNPHYYSFYLPADDGTLWKFICLNTMEDGIAGGGVTVGSTMYNWFVNELNDSSVGRRKVVFCHHPRFSADGTYGDNANMQPVWAAMQNKAMILLSGRVHNYQRMEMRDSTGAVVVGGGVYQVISGTGGTATFGLNPLYTPSGVLAYSSVDNGATRLRLYSDHIDVCFVRKDGTVLNCASLPVATTIPPIVNAGPDQSITLPSIAIMAGTATDTNTPSLTLTNIWTKISGAGTVTFTDANSLTTTVSFSTAGTYVLRLTSNNGVNSSYDEMTVTVGSGAATKLIVVNSSPSGVSMTVSPSDLSGFSNGVTSFNRTYLTTTSVVITAPSTFTGGYVFVKWQRDGVDFSFGLTITASDTINHIFTAIYTLTPEIAYPVNINSSPADGVFVTGTIIGATPQSGYVIGGQTLTLSAPATFGGRAFVEWQLDGVTLSASRNTTDVVTAAGTYTAVYAPLATEFDLILYAVYSGAGGYFDNVSIVCGTAGAGFSTYGLTLVGNATDGIGAGIGPSTVITLVEPDRTYILTADDGTGIITTASIFIARAALPSAHVDITQPVTVGGTGQWSIVSAGLAPYDIAPLGQGNAAGVMWTSAALVAGSYTHVIGPNAIESAVLTNLIVDGDLTTDPFALGTPWTKVGTINYAAGLSFVGVATLTIPVTITTGKYYWLGAWMNSAGTMEMLYNGVIIDSGSLDEFGTGVFVGVGGVNSVVIRNTAGSSTLLRVVLFEYDITFGATLVDPVVLNATDVITNVSCNGGGNGQVALTVTGGVAGYSFLWTKTGFPSNVYPNSAVISSLDAGTYNVTITDSVGNTFSDSYVVTQPTAIVANVTVTNVTCNGLGNGIVTFAPSGGIGPYTYVVDGVFRTIPATNISAGVHSYSVIDANGCTVSGSFTVTEPTILSSSIVITDVLCYGSATGQATVTPVGGTAPYQYSFDGGAYSGTATKTGLTAGPHTVIVKDANNCLKSTDYFVSQPADIVIVNTLTNPSSVGASDGIITSAISGGTYPIVVTYTDGTVFNLASSGTIIYDGLQEGTYTATVVDANGCSKPINQTLTDTPNVPPIDPPNDVDVDRFSVLANCCLGDKIYDVFKAYANGHVQLDCLAYPVILLNEKVDLLRKWYTLGQTIGGAKGIFVFKIPIFSNYTFTISTVGLPTVTYIASLLQTYDENMAALLAALTTAGYDAEYQADSGFIFIYSPMNSFYNGIPVNVLANTGAGNPVKTSVISKNGFLGAVTPCVTDDKFTPNCLDVNDKNLLIEQIRLACDSCLCGDYKINDKV